MRMTEKVKLQWTEQLLEQVMDDGKEKTIADIEEEIIYQAERTLFLRRILKKIKKDSPVVSEESQLPEQVNPAS